MKKFRIFAPVFALALTATIAAAQDPRPTPEPQPSPTPQNPQTPQDPPAPPAPAEDTSANAGVLTPCVATAATATANQPFVERRLCQSLNGIRLSNEQKTRIEAVVTRFADSVRTITAEAMLNDDQRRLLGTRDNEVRAVLTAEQQVTFDRNITALQRP